VRKSLYRRLTGLLLLLGALLINIPYSLLIATFDYPDILRAPSAVILREFQAGGTGLILTWLAFAWSGLPILLAVGLLPWALDEERTPLLGLATAIGVTGMVVQLVGLLRWVFVVPMLATIAVDPTRDPAARAAAEVAFQTVHQYGGVVLGEHLGYAFTCLWMALVSVVLIRSAHFPSWLGALGLLAAAVYSLAHGELFATVIPGAPYWAEAGLVGSLLWLVWMAALSVTLLRAAPRAARSRDPIEREATMA
jgi:Domain of unknown function (DUF4386)